MKESITEIIAKEAVGLPLNKLEKSKQMDCEYAAGKVIDYLHEKGVL